MVNIPLCTLTYAPCHRAELQKALKKRGDTAVHQAVLENDVTLLKELLKRGMPVFNPSDADGGTPLHR